MEVQQIIRFKGGHGLVLEDVAKLLVFVKGLTTAQLIDEQSVGAVASESSEWPQYRHRLLRFGERETSISPVHDKVFNPLWEARGQMVPYTALEPLFEDRVDPRQGVAEAVSRLRLHLKTAMPEVEIVTGGDGYYLKVAA